MQKKISTKIAVIYFGIFIILFSAIFYAFFCIEPVKAINLGAFSAPEILSAFVEPDKVYPGDTMTITVEIKDSFGIESVTVDMGGIEKIELKKTTGTIYQGNWGNKWVVYGTGPREYIAKITATNILDRTTTKEIKWSDPPGPPEVFLKVIGGSGGEGGDLVQQTSDGGYIVAGTTNSYGAGQGDIYLSKFNSSGNLQWAKTIGGALEEGSRTSFQQTSDGGYIVAAYTKSYGAGMSDVFLFRLDSSGNLQWAKTIGGAGDDPAGGSVRLTPDGGFIVAGITNSYGAGQDDAFLFKFNSSGNLQWAKTIGGTWYDWGESMATTSDGGYIVAGQTGSYGAGWADVFLVKINSSGNLQWAKTIGGVDYDAAKSVQQTSDGGYIVTGYTRSYGTSNADNHLFLIKTNSSGNLQWARVVARGTGTILGDIGYSVKQISDGGYIVAGVTGGFGEPTNADIFLLKFDSSGNIQWANKAGGNNNRGDRAFFAQQTPDGGYIVTGDTGIITLADLLLLKTDSIGLINGCSYISSVTPTVSNVTPTVTSPSPTVSTVTPTVSTVTPTVTSPSPTVSAPCFTTYTIDVSKSGSGLGTISSSPSGINCGPTCSASFISGSSVVLTATPNSGSVFSGWSGDCSGVGDCILIMSDNKSAVATFFSNPPTAINLSVDPNNSNDYCGITGYPPVRVRWQFSDSGDSQSAYQIQVDTDAGFSAPIVINTGKLTDSCLGDCGEYVFQSAGEQLSWNTPYYWRIMVWDDEDLPSASWISGPSFTTISHPYPIAKFIFSPQNPSTGEVVSATSTSQSFGSGAPICPTCYLWEITPSAAGTFQTANNIINPKMKFSASADLKLTATDSSGYSCATSSHIGTGPSLPKWIEVPPTSPF